MTEAKSITTKNEKLFRFCENEKLTKEDCPLESSIEQENMENVTIQDLLVV